MYFLTVYRNVALQVEKQDLAVHITTYIASCGNMLSYSSCENLSSQLSTLGRRILKFLPFLKNSENSGLDVSQTQLLRASPLENFLEEWP